MSEPAVLHRSRPRLLLALAVVGLVLVLAIAGGFSLLNTDGSAPAGTTMPVPTEVPDGGFPTEVVGMPVVAIGEANALIAAGAVDGRALAVGGWWIQTMAHGCPAPMRFMADLEAYCSFNIFATRAFAAYTCTALVDSTECHGNSQPPGTDVMSPVVLPEASGWELMWRLAAAPEWRRFGGAPAVVIGHTADPRLWQCPVETRGECRRRFVIDRVAWLAGEYLDIAAPDRRLTTTMVAEEAIAAARTDGEPIVVDAHRAADAPTIDPRLDGIGDSIVWFVRSISAESLEGDPTRAVKVALVDDATGGILASLELAMNDSFQPAFVVVQATTIGDLNGGAYPFYRVERPDGTGVRETMVGGFSSSNDDGVTQIGPGIATVLEAGSYVVRAWRATIDPQGRSGEPLDECTTEVQLDALSTVRLEAAFPASGPCVWVAPRFENVFDG